MSYLTYVSAVLSAALIIFAAAYNIARISQAASEAIARQPEAAPAIQQSIFLPTFCIEGATLFAIAVCLLSVMLK